MRSVAHLPRRPVRQTDIQQLNESGLHVVPYGGVEEDGEMRIYAVKLATDSTAHALGFDESARTWQQISTVEAANLTETEQYLDEALDEWVLAQYGDRFQVMKSV
ncbi:hypothetical protein [Haloferax sp. YSMS24]|uniref:hypothetical protein n=1 Tax=unclassified Haloferax TaxID=2625095 RepID=UPI00398D0230